MLEVLLGVPRIALLCHELDMSSLPTESAATQSALPPTEGYVESNSGHRVTTSTRDDTNLDTPSASMWNFPLLPPPTPSGHISQTAFGTLVAEEQHSSPFDYANFEFALPLYQLASEAAPFASTSRIPEQAGESTVGQESLDILYDPRNDVVHRGST